MKQKNYQRWSRPLLLTLLSIFMAFSGASSAWADELTIANGGNTNNYVPLYGSYADTNGAVSEFIVPAASLASINGKDINKLTFYTSTPSDKKFTATFKVYLKEIAETVYDDATAYGSTDASTVYTGTLDATGATMVIEFSSNYKYYGGNLLVGIEVTSSGNWSSALAFSGETQSGYTGYSSKASTKKQKFIPKTTFTTQTEGPDFVVKDGSTTISSPYAYNFGLTTAGTTKTFKLTNPGTAATPISVDASGANGFTAAVEDNATSIPAGGEKTLTITMPNATASGSVVVTPAGDGLSAFTFNVSGTVRDPNKVYLDFSDGNMPDGWTAVGYSSYYSTYDWTVSTGYISYSATGSSAAGTFTSPKLNFTNGEEVFFETAKYGDSGYSSPSITVEYTTDATGAAGWKTIGSAFTDDTYGNWTSRSVTIPEEGVKRIRFKGWYIHMRNIYGGEEPNEPKMVVTQPATLDFGLYDKDADPAPTKTFTIANTGKATLSGISVTSGNAAFTITGAPTSLAAGASETVTITMSTATTGALSSLITVSATDMEDASFTVTGTVKPAGMPVEDFSGTTIPDGWTSTGSWSFTTDGVAIGTSGTAYLYTPKLKLSAGDFIIIKAKNTDGDASDYITVAGSVNEGTDNYTAYSKKITVANNSDYATFIVTDIPTTINKIRFTGGWVNVDEIHGLTYAPVLAVTKDEAEVNTPAAYDFGECAANATVTYNFANTGGGTINITNVAITGDGAAAYGTNWTEIVAAPFALTITRTYDAGRAGAGAQEAVVTVTTSEGDFVINVTGTDKAANAPELSVTLGEDPVTTGDAANFGTNLKAAPAAKTYTITNSGTGTLTGTIATSDDTQFTVSKTAFSLGAAESTTFDVALVFNTTYGAKAATITIHPTNDGLNDGSHDIIINASASTLDPETWSEDFEGVNPLNGWDNDGFTVKNTAGNGGNTPLSSMMAVSAYGSSYSTLVTPLLIATSGDKLTFDAYFQFGNDPMKVEYSTDGSDWHTDSPLYNFTGSPAYEGKSLNEIEITAPITGEFYLRFTTCYTNAIDNIVGFKLAPAKEHAAIIASNNIPAAGNQYVEYTATVTVKEKAGKADEVVTAELWIGTNKVATEEDVTLTANDEKEITLSFTPATAMSGDAYIKVYNANIDLTTATQAVAITAALVLDETVAPGELTSGSKPSMVVNYNAKNGWNTICMPFVLTTEILNSIFGTGWQAFEFKSYSDGALGFNSTTTFYAGYPYIIYVETAAVNAEGIKLFNKEIGYSATTANSDTYGGATFQGIYAPIAAGSWPDGAYGVTSDGKIAPGNTTTSYMKGFRAYFTGITAGARLSFFDETTGITTVIDAKELNNDGKVYNLNGQRVENAHKGLYIVNGRKVVVK